MNPIALVAIELSEGLRFGSEKTDRIKARVFGQPYACVRTALIFNKQSHCFTSKSSSGFGSGGVSSDVSKDG